MDLPTENYTKSVSKLFMDGITNANNPSVINASIVRNINVTDGKTYPPVIFLILPMEKKIG